MLAIGSEWIALLGGAAAMGLVFALSWRRGLAPIAVVLAGLVVNLYLGALSTALLLFNHETLAGLLIWGGRLSGAEWLGWRGVTGATTGSLRFGRVAVASPFSRVRA